MVQAAPLGLSPHELFTQVLGDTQSPSRVQLDKHAVLLQTKVPQGRSAGVTQLPRPSHAEAGLSDDVLAQTGSLQASPLAK
jgi:hypothetical protein